jgi:hypothetical protein
METRENTGPPCNTQIHAHLFLFNLTASTTFALWLLLAIWLDGTAVASSATISYQSILHLSGHSGETLNKHTHTVVKTTKNNNRENLRTTHTLPKHFITASTLLSFLALVSKNWMPYSLAKFSPSSLDTTLINVFNAQSMTGALKQHLLK